MSKKLQNDFEEELDEEIYEKDSRSRHHNQNERRRDSFLEGDLTRSRKRIRTKIDHRPDQEDF